MTDQHLVASPRQLLFQHCTTNGDGTGTRDAIGDYSTATDFYVAPPAGTHYHIQRLICHIEDTGPIAVDKFGALTALTNGILVRVMRGAEVLADVLNNDPITHNGSFGHTTYDWGLTSFGSGVEVVSAKWDFLTTGSRVALNGNLGDKLVITMQDNLTGLVGHQWMVHGTQYTD